MLNPQVSAIKKDGIAIIQERKLRLIATTLEKEVQKKK
jgi:hypothetical protein